MKKKLVVFVIILLSGSLLSSFYFTQKTQAQGSLVKMELALDYYTKQKNSIENIHPFAVLINVSVPQDQPIAGLDVTLKFDKTKLQAKKVLPGNQSEFFNGYFGVTEKVDNDPTCKSNTADQSERLRCAIDQDNGIISITALNLNVNDFLDTDPDNWSPPTTNPITGDFTLATVIFLPKASDSTNIIELDYSENKSNAYSYVDLVEGPDTQNVLGDETQAPKLNPININNNTTCQTDFDRNGTIWGPDISALFTDFTQSRNYAQTNNLDIDNACNFYYCRTDVNNDGKIWGQDISQLFTEYSKGSCNP